MVFSELYSAYYNAVAKIIKAILEGKAERNTINKIIRENAFEESAMNIFSAIKEERWQVITKDYKTPVKHVPSMPVTLLQKRWLKAILNDKRVKLFGISLDGLDGVEPLFTEEDYCIYDKYLDGDDYSDKGYIERFRTILYAIDNGLPVQAKTVTRKGNCVYVKFIPEKIEYSEKDDKFRVKVSGCRKVDVVNLARIIECDLYDGKLNSGHGGEKGNSATVVLEVKDQRNALERVMLHFAHFEKKVEKLDDNKYKVTVFYDGDDESEMVIRVLSFGPLVEVIEPNDFRERIIEKLKKQKNCGLK